MRPIEGLAPAPEIPGVDLLAACVGDLLWHFPSHRVLAVAKTAERAKAIEERFGSTVKAVPVCSPLYGGCFDAVVSELPRSEVMAMTWMFNVLPSRLAPGATVYYAGEVF